MPDDPAFIRMIAANPDDDAPRLVYADWLDERGDAESAARAEFIRVQCDRARVESGTERSRELWHRETAVLLDWLGRWWGDLPAIPGTKYGVYQRGFIDTVHAEDGAAFVRDAARVFDRLPVRRLGISHLTDALGRRLLALDGVSDVCFINGRTAASLRARWT